MLDRESFEKFGAILAKSQWYPRDRLRKLQERSLTRIVKHAWEQCPGYKERLAPLFHAGTEPDFSRWLEIPILRREDLQTNAERFFAKETPWIAGPSYDGQTSGSTGTPINHRKSTLVNVASKGILNRIYNWHQLDGAADRAIICAVPDGSANYPEGNQVEEWYFGHPEGTDHYLHITNVSIEQQLEWLLERDVKYFWTYPSNAVGLLERLQTEQHNFKPFEAIFLIGELLEDRVRHELAPFGKNIINLYGSTECGIMATSCEKSDSLHVSEEISFMEIVPDDDDLIPGEVFGEVVITPYFNFSMPLIRYAVGDYAVMNEAQCVCGRSSRTLKEVKGRSRHLLKFNDGTSIWPTIRIAPISEILRHKQMQVLQDAPDHFTVLVVPQDPEYQIDHSAAEAEFKRQYHHSISVTIRLVDEIPKTKSGKFQDIKRVF